MAEIEFKCPQCSKPLKSDDTLCGEPMTCPSCSNEVIIPIPGLGKGMQVGDFELLEKLGSGSMGEVWLAYQKTMDRKVALKVLSPKYTSDDQFIKRFMKEVKNSAKLAHPNIVTAFYAGTDKGHYYLAISYITGKTIAEIMAEKGVFGERDALEIILNIADALEYAWDEYKILHRDIKPANIMITAKGEAMLLDLGIAKSLDEESDLTMTGTVVGTPFYISPEQAMAEKEIDFRTDIYSLGTTLYHMVTGTVPYDAPTAMAIIMKHLNAEFPLPEQHNPDISPECSKLIEIMMSKERGKRHSSWGELQRDIQLVLQGKMPAGADAEATADTVIGPGAAIPSGNRDAKGKKESGAKKEKKKTPADGSSNVKKMIPIAIAGAAVLVIVILLFLLPGRKKTAPAVSQGAESPGVSQASGNDIQSSASTPEVSDKIVKKTPEVSPEDQDFLDFCSNLDPTRNTSVHARAFWGQNNGKQVTWKGKVVNVKGRPGKYEILANNPARMNYKGYNLVLVSYVSDDSIARLNVGDTITFTGNVYNYKAKSTSLVIVYVKNVVIKQ